MLRSHILGSRRNSFFYCLFLLTYLFKVGFVYPGMLAPRVAVAPVHIHHTSLTYVLHVNLVTVISHAYMQAQARDLQPHLLACGAGWYMASHMRYIYIYRIVRKVKYHFILLSSLSRRFLCARPQQNTAYIWYIDTTKPSLCTSLMGGIKGKKSFVAV